MSFQDVYQSESELTVNLSAEEILYIRAGLHVLLEVIQREGGDNSIQKMFFTKELDSKFNHELRKIIKGE